MLPFTYTGTHNMARITAFLYRHCRINILQAWVYLSSPCSLKSCPSYKFKFNTAPSFILCSLRRFADMQVGKKIYNYVQACTHADEKFGYYTASGMPYDLPGLTHSSGQSILLEPGKWFAFFKQEIPEGTRQTLWKRGRNPTTRHGNIDR